MSTRQPEDSDPIRSFIHRKGEVVYADRYSKWRPCAHPFASCLPGLGSNYLHCAFVLRQCEAFPTWRFFRETGRKSGPYKKKKKNDINMPKLFILMKRLVRVYTRHDGIILFSVHANSEFWNLRSNTGLRQIGEVLRM